MSKSLEKTYSMPGPWYHISSVRKSARRLLRDIDSGAVESALLAISELGENALRHGMSVPRMPKFEIKISADERAVSVRVTNGFDKQKHYQRVADRISRLQKAADPVDIYIERIREIEKNAHDSGGMGLYRVAAEGGFSLTAEAEENVLVITAVRSVTVGENHEQNNH